MGAALSRPKSDLSLTTRPWGRPTLSSNFLAPWSVMSLNPESKYPNRRSYVVKLRSDATPGALSGRLENLVTGRQREFSSADELLESIDSDLTSAAHEHVADTDGE